MRLLWIIVIIVAGSATGLYWNRGPELARQGIRFPRLVAEFPIPGIIPVPVAPRTQAADREGEQQSGRHTREARPSRGRVHTLSIPVSPVGAS